MLLQVSSQVLFVIYKLNLQVPRNDLQVGLQFALKWIEVFL